MVHNDILDVLALGIDQHQDLLSLFLVETVDHALLVVLECFEHVIAQQLAHHDLKEHFFTLDQRRGRHSGQFMDELKRQWTVVLHFAAD